MNTRAAFLSVGACGSVEKEACVIWVGVHADTGSGGCCGARVMMWLCYKRGWDSRLQGVRPPHPHPPMHGSCVLLMVGLWMMLML